MKNEYSHLTHIDSLADLALYELIPSIVWIFDVDRHGWWWGNEAAIQFWGLETLDQLINKDLSADTQGARDRTLQTFDLAAKQGLTVDPWTTYPQGEPKTLYMKHRAVLLGPERHRGIIAFINEEVNLGEEPQNLLLVEAMRYTTVLVTSFTLDGYPVVENPAATEAYRSIDPRNLPAGTTAFSARFADLDAGNACMQQALAEKGGRWAHLMRTEQGLRFHTLDIRMTRNPLTGEYLFLVVEYDTTPLKKALDHAKRAQSKLHHLAHYDALTGLPSLRLLQQRATALTAQAKRYGTKVAVMFIDLDGFKRVNDTWGHDAGDRVLKIVAKALADCLRECDQVARIGGDEFVALVSEVQNRDGAAKVASKIIARLKKPIPLQIDSSEVFAQIGASIGIAFFPDHGTDLEELIKIADKYMYQVKREGKNGFLFAADE